MDYRQVKTALSSKRVFSLRADSNIFSLFHTRFSASIDHPAIETAAARRYCYSDLDQASARYARFLAGLGLKPGDRVAAQLEKSVEGFFFYLGCLRAGLVYLPLNPAYRRAELDYFLTDAEPRVFVASPTSIDGLAELLRARGVAHVYSLDGDGAGTLHDQSRISAGDFSTVVLAPDDLAVILYTSGTTGRPKGAMLTHANLAANVLALHQAWGWRHDDVLLHALPLYHIHGLFVACHCALLGASTMLFLPTFDTQSVLRLLPRATVFMGVPTYYTRLLAEPGLDRTACRNMRLFISGSAPLLVQTFDEFRDRTGHTILERYGMTETGMNASNPLTGKRIAGTVGRPLPGVSLRVVDQHDHALPAGQVGELQVKGRNVFKGYWRKPEQTAQDFTPDGFFRTGDLAKIDADGYIAIVGREKDLIISGGLNVYPKEVESYLDRLDGVAESAVIGVPHVDFGEAVVAVVVPAAPGRLSEDNVVRALKENIAGFKVPKRVVFVDELPRNAMGKVQKNLLRERFGALLTGAGTPLSKEKHKHV